MTAFHDAGALASAEAARDMGLLDDVSSVTEPGLRRRRIRRRRAT